MRLLGLIPPISAVPSDRCVGIVRTGRPNVAFAVNEYGSSELLGC